METVHTPTSRTCWNDDTTSVMKVCLLEQSENIAIEIQYTDTSSLVFFPYEETWSQQYLVSSFLSLFYEFVINPLLPNLP